MSSGDLPTKKISRVRTFQDDISSIRPGETKSPAAPGFQETGKETAPIKQKLSEENIFRVPKPNLSVVANPQIVASGTDKKSALIPVAIPKKNDLSDAVKGLTSHSPFQKTTNGQGGTLSNQVISKEDLVSIRKDVPTTIISDDTSGEGSIITDKKRTRFSLVASIGEAAQTWFTTERESFKDRAGAKRKAIPTVRPVADRKEILQKAAEQSAMAPRDDHLQLATKFALPKAKAKQDNAPIQIKKKSPPEKPAWSHFTGHQKDQVPQERVASATDVAEKVSEQPVATVLPPPPTEKTSPTTVPTPMPTIATPPVTKETPEISEKIESKPPAIKFVGKKNKSSFAGLSKFLTYAGIVTVMIIAATSGIGLVWWLFSGSNQPQTLTSTSTPAPLIQAVLVNYEDNIRITLPLRKEELWQSILSAEARTSSGLVLVSPMNPDDTTPTTEEILAVVNWQANPAFLRSIEKINFGRYRGVPFIVIRTTNFDTAFGSLLSAEATLPKDLTIFTYENVEVLEGRFTDELIQNHDIRVLKKVSGQDALVYSFVNRNTIVITSDRDTFLEVANRLR
ncbi:MAG: hypothetical protein WDZ56_00100 [Candidatus Paceibacterota bacterium]